MQKNIFISVIILFLLTSCNKHISVPSEYSLLIGNWQSTEKWKTNLQHGEDIGRIVKFELFQDGRIRWDSVPTERPSDAPNQTHQIIPNSGNLVSINKENIIFTGYSRILKNYIKINKLPYSKENNIYMEINNIEYIKIND